MTVAKRKTSYEIWLDEEDIPVVGGYGVTDVRELALKPWKRTGGRGAYIDHGVVVGNDCKVQNHALVYHPAVLGDGVFVGPAAVLTNDRYPRAVTPDGALKGSDDWQPVGVMCRDGASIGARAVCVAPVTIGRWAMVAAGSVVTHDVAPYAIVGGTPAKLIRLRFSEATILRLQALAWWTWPDERLRIAQPFLASRDIHAFLDWAESTSTSTPEAAIL